jgi:H+/Cl- antiporter ClcA
MEQQTGKYIIIAGIVIVISGIIIYFFYDYFKWFGKLPGDINIRKKNYLFYFPVVTMIVISVALTIIVNIIKRFL